MGSITPQSACRIAAVPNTLLLWRNLSVHLNSPSLSHFRQKMRCSLFEQHVEKFTRLWPVLAAASLILHLYALTLVCFCLGFICGTHKSYKNRGMGYVQPYVGPWKLVEIFGQP